MNKQAETKTIEKWLRMVDKPLATKEGDNKDAEPREERGNRKDGAVIILEGDIMRKLFIITMLPLFLVGCTQPTVMRYTTEIFPPTDKVEVFHTKPVDRDYIEIGEVAIRLKKSTQENAVSILCEKAKELGADGFVIIGERSRGAAIMPTGSMALAVPLRELYGVAIKYR